MPLFGFRKDKKREQSHIQAAAELTKSAAPAGGDKAVREFRPAKPAKIARGTSIETASARTASAIPASRFSNATDPIIRPRVTEKSGLLSQNGVYTFQISENATKSSVAKAMQALYKVTPVRVAMINLPAKRVFVRGKKGVVPGIRKAMVTVKLGEKIDFV